MPPRQQIPPEILAAWDRGDKVHAIRALRVASGLGLKEAQEALETGAYTVEVPHHPQPLAAVPDAAFAALKRGDKLEAIKLARAATGLGLKEAKAAVETLTGGVVPSANDRPRGLAPGEVPRGRINWVGILTFVGVAMLAIVVASRLLRP